MAPTELRFPPPHWSTDPQFNRGWRPFSKRVSLFSRPRPKCQGTWSSKPRLSFSNAGFLVPEVIQAAQEGWTPDTVPSCVTQSNYCWGRTSNDHPPEMLTPSHHGKPSCKIKKKKKANGDVLIKPYGIYAHCYDLLHQTTQGMILDSRNRSNAVHHAPFTSVSNFASPISSCSFVMSRWRSKSNMLMRK
jgi:hypothetical protein